MVKKILLACSAFVVLGVVGIAVVITLTWDTNAVDGAKGTANDEHSLSEDLEKTFGAQPKVEFVCSFPVVGIAPCVLNNDMGSREVTLTFTNYDLPEGVAAEERARRIAMLAFKTSAFVKEADKTDVIFEEIERSKSASVSRTSKYTFSREELIASKAPSGNATADGEEAQE